jgi:hypothetical protein
MLIPRSARGSFIPNDRFETTVGGSDIGWRWRYRTGRPHHELAGQYRSCVARADRAVYRRRVNRHSNVGSAQSTDLRAPTVPVTSSAKAAIIAR